jgi:hypothetical protein
MPMKICRVILIVIVGALVAPPHASAAKLKPETVRSWEVYVQLTEKRIENEFANAGTFLRAETLNSADAKGIETALKSGRVHIGKVRTPGGDGREIRVPDGMIHHWFGSIFLPNTRVKAVLDFVQNYDQHQRYFKEVEASKVLSRDGDMFRVFFRFVRKKVVTVHYNTEHSAVYRHHGEGRESSRSFTTRIAEIKDAGTASESEKPVGDDSGYMWRLNSYWRFKQQGGGVIIECESISLSRSIPFGFGWLVKSFVESVPRESLESTLTSIRDGVR